MTRDKHPGSYPYIVVRLIPAAFEIIRIVRPVPLPVLRLKVKNYAVKRQLNCGLVLDSSHCIYFHADGTQSRSDQIPSGGFVFPKSQDAWERELAPPAREKKVGIIKAEKRVGVITKQLLTADGIPVAVGMCLYMQCVRGADVVFHAEVVKEITAEGQVFGPQPGSFFVNGPVDLSRCYTSVGAALKAPAAKRVASPFW